MKQKLLLLKLAFKLAGMFMWDFYKESKREIADKTLYPQEKYGTCLARATEILINSMDKASRFYALAIANHRLCKHGDSVVKEIQELEEDLTYKESKQASRGFWLG